MEFVRVCRDVVIPKDLRPQSSSTRNAFPNPRPVSPGSGRRMAIDPNRTWTVGFPINCRFLNGADELHEKVALIAAEWSQHANVTFAFGNEKSAEIRISFDPGGSWSAVGTDAMVRSYFPRHAPTMNFGWLSKDLPDTEWQNVVLHEFGHALGCVHEHQSPNFVRVWNRERVLQFFSGPPNYWDKEEIERNILERYSVDLKATEFDPESIMLYMFDSSFFNDGMGGTNINAQLSTKDIEMISSQYPF